MLTLPIKKKWFDMILSGEKKEEYRDMSPYYNSRFSKYFYLTRGIGGNIVISSEEFKVQFRNGYRKDSPSFVAYVRPHIGFGKVEWGAEPDVQYYVLEIKRIL